MRRIHIGHHFYGAGNTGDDLMLAGFLEALGGRPEAFGYQLSAVGAASQTHFHITCCTPFDREVLKLRFPEVEWLPYDGATRLRAIEACDLWLGLGGSPWQNAVSRWFIDHLEQERRWCAATRKPMRFLGVGGQDAAAYDLPETRAVCQQAESIWTRDAATAEALSQIVSGVRVRQGADLAHIWLEKHPPRPAKVGRFVTVLNFDYASWPGMEAALKSLEALPARERIWLAQESRALPGAELQLHAQLLEQERARWSLQLAERPSMLQATQEWPCGEWQLSSRFHATIVAAWAGSKTVVLATNDKLRGIATELGYPALAPDADLSHLANLLQASQSPSRPKLETFATLARQSCNECLATQ